MVATLAPVGIAPDLRRYAKVLLATDLAPSSEMATAAAFRLAAQLGAAVLVVNVIDVGALRRASGRGAALHHVRAMREAAMSEVVARGRAHGVEVSFLIWEGDPAESVIEAALSENVDLIVIGNRGHSGVGRALIGSVSDEVVRTAHCPVIVVRQGRPE